MGSKGERETKTIMHSAKGVGRGFVGLRGGEVGICGLCSIRTRHLFTRVQRKNKGLVCVEKWGNHWGVMLW